MAEWTRNTPWRQGHLLPDEAIKTIGLPHPESPNDTVVIVATHDCDLAQDSDKEPNVEVIIGRRILKLDGNFTHAKTSRTLHIEFESKIPFLTEFAIVEKCSIRKDALVAFNPKKRLRLSPPNLAIFQLWLASRYRRSAFPDEFEQRLIETKLSEKITKAVRPHGKMITAVFFDVDEGQEVARTGPNDIYVLDIFLLHAIEPDFFAAESAAKNAKTAIKQAFTKKLFDSQSHKWQKIELRYIEVVSESGMTYHQSKFLKKWRLDHISLSADPQQPVLAE